MLPVLFTLTLSPQRGPWVLLAVALAAGAWQLIVERRRGAEWPAALRAFALWTLGTEAVLYFAARTLGGAGHESPFRFTAPLALPLHTYGIAMAAAFLVAMWLAGRAAARAGLDKERVMDLCFWILISSMVGSRLLFIVVNWQEYARNPWAIFAVWNGGLVFYGGFVAAVLCSVWYLRRHGMKFFPVADALIPSVAIGHAIGRLGCFSAGCCWGEACDPHLAWAARFPPEAIVYQSQLATHLIVAGAPHTLPIHPTQLYESLGELCIFAALTLWSTRKQFQGELLALYLVLYAPLRAAVETLRGDEERGRVFSFLGPAARHAWWNLSTSELLSICLFGAGVALLVVLRRRAAPAGAAAS
jgi:phosphatidylglycerol:prolipoprotein diacylglycerol transferase